MSANTAGNKSKNTTFKTCDIRVEEIINFLLGPDTIVLRFERVLTADHGNVGLGFAFWPHHGQANLFLVQHMAVANCPDVRRAQIRAVSKPLVLVHQVNADLAQFHFLPQVRVPNQKPMIAPNIDISSGLKMMSE